MHPINPNKAGLALGTIIGAWHLLWALLVALRGAQALIDFIFWLHFIKPVYVVEDFALARALILVAVTAAIGYALGYSFALIWNRVHR